MTYFFILWMAGTFWQGYSLLSEDNFPEMVKIAFERFPIMMFATFAIALLLTWPYSAFWDIRSWYIEWRIKRVKYYPPPAPPETVDEPKP